MTCDTSTIQTTTDSRADEAPHAGESLPAASTADASVRHCDAASQAFSMVVFRGLVQEFRTRPFAAELMAAGCDLAMLDVPSGATALAVGELARLGMPVLALGTRLRLIAPSADLPAVADAEIRVAGASDATALSQSILGSERIDGFGGTVLDPLLGEAALKRWLEQRARHALSQRDVILAKRADAIVAFAILDAHGPEGAGHAELFGLDSEVDASLAIALIKAGQASSGASTGSFDVEATDTERLAAVMALGAKPSVSIDRCHVHSLLSGGEPIYSEQRTFSQRDVAGFAVASGDDNPIHLDDEAARAAGFPRTIAHGALGVAELSRILGTQVPGPGTILGRLDFAFHRPMLTGALHTIEARAIGGLKASGPMNIVATIRDAAGAICAIGRANVLYRPPTKTV